MDLCFICYLIITKYVSVEMPSFYSSFDKLTKNIRNGAECFQTFNNLYSLAF